MHLKVLPAVQVSLFLALFTFLGAPPAKAGVPFASLTMEKGPGPAALVAFAVVGDQPLQEYIRQNISQIENFVNLQKSVQEKLAFVHDRVSRVAQFRRQHWSKSAFVEYDLDMKIKPFESFPKPQSFKKDRCADYQSRLINDWEPQASEFEPSQRGVSKALKILNKICS